MIFSTNKAKPQYIYKPSCDGSFDVYALVYDLESTSKSERWIRSYPTEREAREKVLRLMKFDL